MVNYNGEMELNDLGFDNYRGDRAREVNVQEETLSKSVNLRVHEMTDNLSSLWEDYSDKGEKIEMDELSPNGRRLERGPEDHDQDNQDWSEEWEEEHRPFVLRDKNYNSGGVRKIVGNKKLFGERNSEYIDATKVFDLLVLEDESNNPYFVKWLMDKK